VPETHRPDTEEDIVGSLRRAARLSDDQFGHADDSGGGSNSQPTVNGLRPWTIEAAMEPLPPLAPPVETPLTESRPANQQAASGSPRFSVRVIAESVLLIVLILIAILLLVAKHSGR